jgi:hypothetical protein
MLNDNKDWVDCGTGFLKLVSYFLKDNSIV